MRRNFTHAIFFFLAICATASTALAQSQNAPIDEGNSNFVLSSPNFKQGEKLSKANEFDGFAGCSRTLVAPFSNCSSNGSANKYIAEGLNCNGRNLPPTFNWKGAPAGAKSFAFTIYNPDIKTGSGWWHFIAYNIAAFNNNLNPSKLPNGALAAYNDGGSKYFMGPCPAAGSGTNRYIFTVYALDVDKLEIAPTASAALASYLINRHKIASAVLMATYERP